MKEKSNSFVRDMAVEVAGKLAVKVVDTVAEKVRSVDAKSPTNRMLLELEMQIQTHKADIQELKSDNESLVKKTEELMTEIDTIESKCDRYKLMYERMRLGFICLAVVATSAIITLSLI